MCLPNKSGKWKEKLDFKK